MFIISSPKISKSLSKNGEVIKFRFVKFNLIEEK